MYIPLSSTVSAWIPEKNPRILMFFSVSKLKDRDTLGNKDSAVHCWCITFNVICHSIKDQLINLLNFCKGNSFFFSF